MTFAEGYLGKLRAQVGNMLLLVPGARCVIINDDAEVLLELRRDFQRWGLPGGNAEPGEDLAAIARRELLEETGLDVPDLAIFGLASNPDFETVVYPNGDRCQYVVALFVAKVGKPGTLAISDESLALRWFPLNDLPDNMLGNMRRTIDAYLRFASTGSFQQI